MKLKHKLILDGIFLLLLIMLMDYSLTGGLVHEILGLVILAGFIIHAFVNRKYYKKMFSVIRSGGCDLKNKTAFAVNMILPLAAALMLLSSLAISRDLLPGISAMFNSELWVPVHIISAVVLLICVFIHVCMHAKVISAFIGQYIERPAMQKMKSAGLRVMAFLFALLVVKSSFSNMADAANLLPSSGRNEAGFDQSSNKQNNELIIEEEDASDQDGYVIEPEPEPEPEETVSLEDYLGSMYCTGCGRHCSLLTPRCGKGENQAARAADEYYEIYDGQSL